MIFNLSFISALFVLLLPIPLAFLIPASSNAAPDPSKIRRLRVGLIRFAVGVALIQSALLWNSYRLFDGPPPGGSSATAGALIWAVMSWFFLVLLVIELRRPAPDSFPGDSRRAASLRPRHADSPVPWWAWWAVGTTYASAATVALWTVSVPGLSMVLLVGAVCVLLVGRWAVNRSVLVSEPMLPEGQAELQQAYLEQRKIRAWMMFTTISIGVGMKVALSIAYGWDAEHRDIQILLRGTIALLALLTFAYALVESRGKQRIRGLRLRLAELCGGDSRP